MLVLLITIVLSLTFANAVVRPHLSLVASVSNWGFRMVHRMSRTTAGFERSTGKGSTTRNSMYVSQALDKTDVPHKNESDAIIYNTHARIVAHALIHQHTNAHT